MKRPLGFMRWLATKPYCKLFENDSDERVHDQRYNERLVVIRASSIGISCSMSASFRPAHRVRKQEDFQRVYQARAYAANDLLVVNGAANGLAHSRLGLSVSKRVGNAVVRNRWKRLIREAFRLTRSELPSGFDLVVRPQNGAKPELEAIQRALGTLARRIAKRVGAGGQRSEVGSQGSGGQPE